MIDKKTQGRRRLGLVAAVIVLVLAIALVVHWGCGDGGIGVSGFGPSGGAKTTDVKAIVGETVKVGGAQAVVTAFAPTEHPALPEQPLDGGAGARAGTGQTFYQALVYIKNGGTSVFRVDPRDFDLVVGNGYVSIDPARTGPAARSLLPGASLDLMVTFRAPAGKEVELRWRPAGSGTAVRFSGQRKPAGMAGLPGRSSAGNGVTPTVTRGSS
jgi:Domain of unknown function (DUF4352)